MSGSVFWLSFYNIHLHVKVSVKLATVKFYFSGLLNFYGFEDVLAKAVTLEISRKRSPRYIDTNFTAHAL
jgi:hypothetical protein